MKNVTKMQYNSTLYLISRPLFIGIGIIKIIKNVGSDIWISLILGIIFGLAINYMLTKLKEKENKALGIIVNSSLFLLCLLIISKLISSIYLDLTPNLMIILPFIIVIYYTVQKGYKNFYKSSLLILIINLAFYLFAFMALIPTIKIDNFLPLFTSSTSKILLSAIDFALISTLPYTTLSNFKERYNYKAYLCSCLTIAIIFLIVVGSLGVNLSITFRYPEYIVFKKISLLSFIENIENILYATWIFDSFGLCSMAALNIKRLSNNKTLIIILLIITGLSNFLFLNNFTVLNFIITNFTYIISLLFILYVVSKTITKKD